MLVRSPPYLKDTCDKVDKANLSRTISGSTQNVGAMSVTTHATMQIRPLSTNATRDVSCV